MTIKNTIKILSVSAALLCASVLSGCSVFNMFDKTPDLPGNPTVFEMKKSDSDDMMTITYDGKAYMPFGILGKTVHYPDTLRDCLGYIGDDKNNRVYTLCQDPYDNYLLIRNVSGFMDQPQIWRKCETRKQDIFTPDYIEPLDYEEWTGSGVYSEMPAVTLDIANDADGVVELAIGYKLNGRDGGATGVRNADRSIMEKGEDLCLEISEYAIKDKLGEIDKDDSFDIDVTFSVTAADGKTYRIEYCLSGKAKLGDEFRLTLTGDAENGYKISERSAS